jgi:hypothetical protein
MFSIAALSHKAVVGVLVGILAVGTAVGTLASQDMLPGQSQDSLSGQAADDGQAENGDVENGADQRDVVGIPEDNPNHQPDDGDDECEKGETAVKTTPSGKQVNVPCHAVEPGRPSFSQGQNDGDEEADNGDETENDED